MLRFGKSSVCVLAATVFYIAPAHGQATRTWVSGVGDDVNPCSRTAPCKTFAGAISKTAAGGEINCLDPGGFGGVTITKALSIVCNYTEGGVLSAGAGVNGIVINAGVNDHVYLRGLDLHGAGNAQNGIRFIAGASLTIEDSVIRAYNASNGLGISFQPSASSSLVISNTTISNNGTGGTGGGIKIQPTGTGSARVTLVNVRVSNNANTGINIDTTGSTGTGVNASISNSAVSGHANIGVNVVQPAGAAPAQLNIIDSQMFNNPGIAIVANGVGVSIRVGGSAITGNGTGLATANGALLKSWGNNYVDGNAVNGVFNLPNIPQF